MTTESEASLPELQARSIHLTRMVVESQQLFNKIGTGQVKAPPVEDPNALLVDLKIATLKAKAVARTRRFEQKLGLTQLQIEAFASRRAEDLRARARTYQQDLQTREEALTKLHSLIDYADPARLTVYQSQLEALKTQPEQDPELKEGLMLLVQTEKTTAQEEKVVEQPEAVEPKTTEPTPSIQQLSGQQQKVLWLLLAAPQGLTKREVVAGLGIEEPDKISVNRIVRKLQTKGFPVIVGTANKKGPLKKAIYSVDREKLPRPKVATETKPEVVDQSVLSVSLVQADKPDKVSISTKLINRASEPGGMLFTELAKELYGNDSPASLKKLWAIITYNNRANLRTKGSRLQVINQTVVLTQAPAAKVALTPEAELTFHGVTPAVEPVEPKVAGQPVEVVKWKPRPEQLLTAEEKRILWVVTKYASSFDTPYFPDYQRDILTWGITPDRAKVIEHQLVDQHVAYYTTRELMAIFQKAYQKMLRQSQIPGFSKLASEGGLWTEDERENFERLVHLKEKVLKAEEDKEMLVALTRKFARAEREYLQTHQSMYLDDKNHPTVKLI